MRQPTRRQVAALVERMAGGWLARERAAEPVRASPSSDPALERRLTALDTRLAHLEAQLEALQDALYRQSVRADETRAELRERTDPEWIARELSADSRRRGI